MKTRSPKQLVIVRETLVNLREDQLAQPRGASLWTLCTFCCDTSGGGFCDHDGCIVSKAC